MTDNDPQRDDSNPIYPAAVELHRHGITVIPIRADGSKVPAIKGWPEHATTEDELGDWFIRPMGATGPRFTALGIVTGPISGNLELAEIEGDYAELLPDLVKLADEAGARAVWDKVTAGWLEISPSGGYHWFYRVDGPDVAGNQKLAQDDPIYDDQGRKSVPTIAETRGARGYVVGAPTAGAAHATGKPWTRLRGGPATMAVLTPEERDQFTSLFRMLDQSPKTAAVEERPRPHRDPEDGLSPGDDYENKTSWTDILEPHGWSLAMVRGNTHYWTRPGKQFGISATTGNAEDRDRLYVFSSSTEFETEVPYTKFGAYTLLSHEGDHSKAAAALRKMGYGEPGRPKVQPPAPAGIQARIDQAMTGTNHTVVPLVQPDAAKAPEPDPKPKLQAVPNYGLTMTDDSNAALLIDMHGEGLRYHVDNKRWLVWNGYVWETQSDIGGRARELAKDAARRLEEDGPDGRDKALRHKRYSLSDRGLSAMLNTARTDQAVMVHTNDLDRRPWELNTPGGIVNLRTGELSPSDPAKMHSRTTACTPSPTADQTPWLDFLKQTFPDPDVLDYVHRLAGYSTVGEVREHILPFAHGGGGNGKGVFLETIKAVLGTYAGKAPANFLMKTHHPDHPTAIADLSGRRFVISSEVNQSDKFDEQKVKELTGGDTVTARHMGKDFFEFTPTHHLWLMANDEPAVESGGKSFWRRLRLIPFTHEVAEEDQDEGLQARLRDEHAAAVLQWLVDGAVLYAKRGLKDEPEAVRAATERYQGKSDTVGQFLDECTYYGPDYATQNTTVSALRAAYEKWCAETGNTPLGARRLAMQLAKHGIQAGKNAPRSNGVRQYGGVLLMGSPQTLDTGAAASGQAGTRDFWGQK